MDHSSKIPINHALTMYMLASFSPIVRLSSTLSAKLSAQAGWVSALLSFALCAGTICVLSGFFHGQSERKGLFERYRDALGSTAANILCSVYAAWLFVVVSLYVRTFAERCSASILPSTPIEFFVIALLLICCIMLSGPFHNFARFAHICFYAAALVFVVIFLVEVPRIQLQNLYPVTTLDALPVIAGTYPYLGIFGYITFLLFIGDEIEHKSKLKDLGMRAALVLLAANLIVFFTTVGIFGEKLTQNLMLPFFMSVKTIQLFDSLERLESMFIILWMTADIAIVTLFLRIILRLIGKITSCQHTDALKNPLLLGTYLLSMCFVGNAFEISAFSERIALAMNILLGMAVPIVVWVILKARRKTA